MILKALSRVERVDKVRALVLSIDYRQMHVRAPDAKTITGRALTLL